MNKVFKFLFSFTQWALVVDSAEVLAVDGVMVMEEDLEMEVEHFLATHVSSSFSSALMSFSG